MADESTIRRRLIDILTAINAPVTASEIRQRAQYPKPEGVILMALKAMKRDGLVREWQPGRFVHKGYHDQVGVKHRQRTPEKITPKKKIIREREPSRPTPITKNKIHKGPQAPINAGGLLCPLPPSQENNNMPDDKTKSKITLDLDDLERCLKPVRIENVDLKLSVFSRLSEIISDDVGEVLDSIREDLTHIAGHQG